MQPRLAARLPRQPGTKMACSCLAARPVAGQMHGSARCAARHATGSCALKLSLQALLSTAYPPHIHTSTHAACTWAAAIHPAGRRHAVHTHLNNNLRCWRGETHLKWARHIYFTHFHSPVLLCLRVTLMSAGGGKQATTLLLTSRGWHACPGLDTASLRNCAANLCTSTAGGRPHAAIWQATRMRCCRDHF